MEATRIRIGAIVEWVVAAGFILAALAAGSIVMREFRTVSAVVPVIAREETLSEIATRLGPTAVAGSSSVERAPNGERLTRVYEYASTRFVLVFEPFERGAEARVAAIYLP